ncbi:tRNA (guanosine(37)-N1)-methyltransferase TrmD [bacterium (Candidatus Blackallbacteria) CG17_big_fil_post_rev_8_21_14_2_50_48_46]|uniref:tRNA (guanine-N(1)-)-methyltransferase n=1 Tax=bacterium (Candidatus Blackallbacteria) CG17_big_fil_post_rev_8_21_14_2_50_48_46 TaxID=2014261 RepID=A0A2M7FZU0_9BACT|nr:MAG: tRNA (guanosine(37)-N1)-methyltransferase TrmD [bacterium (Candidatus Blackallbacteria) CG18_big_fil_WC_8_21_14_2_50_49_26]PIW14942.1 MAG: tRNA (guanosine(37)-N1)-methyltransferase TrmD [bacterium (Candidatus Blackallbacteria) CG17_big_fil_post_rev_8_21_14_2_50_48_46]PIW44332.1 MAG: tRNA (guanosine(37)-N1)-methyltransferase TrmD [bacterium (Candidatus Blackallbacteria) CG13_big_fil_rev_8_21_14_2_50_49_14]
MHLDFCTLFPDFFSGPLHSSILKRAAEQGNASYHLHNIRDWSRDKHRTVDDRPFGGGPGMVLKPEPIFEMFETLHLPENTPVILTTPRARLFQQSDALALAKLPRVVFLCGHYEGIDERVQENLCTHFFSIGSYVLTGGEPAALVMADAIVRLIPGVVGCSDSIEQDSFMDDLLDCPHYTRPAKYRDWTVPEVLLNGNHAEIAKWRRRQQIIATWKYRPDLLKLETLKPEELKLIQTLEEE